MLNLAFINTVENTHTLPNLFPNYLFLFIVVEDKPAVLDLHKSCAEEIAEREDPSVRSEKIVEKRDCLFSVLWSECFKPRGSSEILGNNSAGVRLKKWLSEWKTLRERKLEALKKLEEKKRQR